MSSAKDDLQAKVFKKYGFTYKQPAKTTTQRQESATIKALLPK
jgi:transposase